MAVNLLFNRVEQFSDGSGNPYSGAKLFTYVGGSVNTKQTTYVESTGTTPNTNPIILDSFGQLPQPVWLTAGATYKLVLAPSTDTDPPTSPLWTLDGVKGINDSTGAVSEWTSGPSPLFVNATTFTLVGDQTTTFSKGRRVRATVTAGTVYGTIVSSTFAALTTVVLAMDSGALDSGLSAVSYGIISPANPSINADMIHRKGAAVASAATTDIWSVAGDFVHVTGTATITSFGTAPYAGAERTVIFDGAATVTQNSTSLQLPGQQSITVAAGSRMIVRADTTANMIVVDYVPQGGVALQRSYLAGLTLSTAGASATMVIAAGAATDSTNSVVMVLPAAINKTTAAWAVGSGNGGLDTGAIANTTWYKFFEILRPDTGVVDVIFTLAALATGPALPANYTKFRYIGSGLTSGAAQWVLFIQDGDYFEWDGPVNAVNTTNPGTSAVTPTLQTPLGVNTLAIYSMSMNNATSNNMAVLLSDPAVTDRVPDTTTNFSLVTQGASGTSISSGQFQTRTDTSSRIRYRLSASGASDLIRITTTGFIDHRGRDA